MEFHGGNIYQYGEDSILDFSSNINPLGIPESFRRALCENMEEFTRYPDIAYRVLREEIAKYLGLPTGDWIVPGNGAVEIIYKAMGAAKGRKLITLCPTFAEYRRAARLLGMELEEVDIYEEAYRPVFIERILEAVIPQSVVLLCNPNNPIGSLLSLEQMKYLAEQIQKRESILIIDEAFIEFTDGYPDTSMVREIERYPGMLVIRAATKFFGMPGIRLGYGVSANQRLLAGIRSTIEPWNVNTAAVIAGKVILQDKAYIQASREWIQKERSFLWEQLQLLRSMKLYRSMANFYLAKIEVDGIDAWELKERLLEHGILIRTPDGFHGLTPQHFRIAVKDRISNENLIAALKEELEHRVQKGES